MRRARSIASGVRAPDERVRVEADVQAHLAELAANGRESSFGAARNARHLLRRVDRSKPVVLFPSGTSDHVRKFIVEEGPWIVTAILAFLLIRAFLAEVFYIPSSSMVPTLLEGDRVVVTKPGACGRMPERWSIVTFDHQGTTFVKRVIGLGGEKVLLLGGDPYIDGELLVRPRDLRDDLRASYRTWDLAPPSPEWRAADDGDARVLEYAGPTLWSGGYDQAGHPFFPGDVPLRDVYATLDAERDAGGRIGLELAYVSPRDGSVSTTLVLDAADTGTRLTVEAPDGRRKVIVLSEEGRAGRIRLELAYVDGEVVVRGPGGKPPPGWTPSSARGAATSCGPASGRRRAPVRSASPWTRTTITRWSATARSPIFAATRRRRAMPTRSPSARCSCSATTPTAATTAASARWGTSPSTT